MSEFSGLRILILDDEEDLADLIKDLLEPHGFIARAFINPVDAIESVKRDAVDLILSDYNLPQMNGIEVFKTISETCPACRYVLISGGHLDRVDEFNRKSDFKIHGILSKPFQEQTLLQVLKKALG